MIWVDYVIVGVIGLSVVISFFKGFLKEVMALAVWVAAFWLAFTLAPMSEGMLAGAIEVPSARLAVTYGLIFVVTLLAGGIITYFVGKLVAHTGLSGSDRMLGLIFGAARGVVLVVAVTMVAGLTPVPRDPWWRESTLLPYFEALSSWTIGFLPDEIQDYFNYGGPVFPVGEQVEDPA